MSWTAVGVFLRLLCRLSVHGVEHIPATGGVVFASNHIAALDTLLIPYTVLARRGFRTVWAPAKAELFRIPLLARLLRSWGAFPVRRGQGDLRAIRQMIRLMRTEKVMIFPEGTRSRDGRLHAGNRMVGKLVYHAQPVVVPTAVVGTDRLFPRARWGHRGRPRVAVYYGKPLDLQRFYALPDTKETAEAIVREVMGAIASLLDHAQADAREAASPPACQPVRRKV